MAKGIALHIGVNQVCSVDYEAAELGGCINDAEAMQTIAKSQGYQTQLLQDENAKKQQVINAIKQSLAQLNAGDIFLFTFSGHGTQYINTDSDLDNEPDNQDEALCLYDHALLDDELGALWSQANAGVRILMVIDACHSGTVSRDLSQEQTKPRHTIKSLTLDQQLKLAKSNKALYQEAKSKAAQQLKGNPIKASVRLLAGCQDNQFSHDGAPNSIFTAALLKIWNNGAFEGYYYQLLDEASAILRSEYADLNQVPKHSVIGVPNPAFDREKPFTI